ncbi:pregnancy-specific beta-1-glyco 7 [Pelobates cultripes]|uniref:Pregnancy-specific beta-1-glyco 7 n=1 Tax=Pelobates cultripes TaxID=61616 RepID=A0AAD1WXM6_PELCU|nr:pregnancy-specific beta-1-glyco 7 [Pelobates cultripes]
MTCVTGGYAILDCSPKPEPILEYNCDNSYWKPFRNYWHRVDLDVSSGCATIRNVQKSDIGRYFWVLMDKDRTESLKQYTRYSIMDKVSITSLSSSLSNSGLTTSLRVQFTGEMEHTVTWTRDGGDLPEGHQLSEFNDTLTVRSTDYGTYRVTVTNSVSEDHAQLTLTAEPAPVSGRFSVSWIAVSIMAAAICSVLLGRLIKQKMLNPDIKPQCEDVVTAHRTERVEYRVYPIKMHKVFYIYGGAH